MGSLARFSLWGFGDFFYYNHSVPLLHNPLLPRLLHFLSLWANALARALVFDTRLDHCPGLR